MRFGMLLSAASAAVVLAPVARADIVDDQFVSTLTSQGITGDRGQLIGDGQATCDQYGSPGMNGLLLQIMNQGFTDVQATHVITVGLRAYCPEKAAAGVMTGLLGSGLVQLSLNPNPPDNQIAQLATQSAFAVCKTVTYVPDANGVKGAIDGLTANVGISQPAAARVVALSVQASCPQYMPQVNQVVPNSTSEAPAKQVGHA
jgi:hypothetical protein